VREGEEYDVVIEAVGRKGDGIAKIENFIVFVPGTKAGDHVKVKIASVGGSFATASVVA
jgi:predicted RNA-binding protein with TRAM domain